MIARIHAHQPPPKQNNSRQQRSAPDKVGLCFYHRRFGDKPHHCVSPCDMRKTCQPVDVNGCVAYFLFVTGCQLVTFWYISVLPPTGIERRNNTQGPVLLTANGSNIKSYGRRTVTLDLPPGSFQWNFVLVDVSGPILGADFLRANSLFVDMKHQRLVNAESFTSIPLQKNTFPPVAINAISLSSNTMRNCWPIFRKNDTPIF